ncbi:hypothetical protein ALI22I_02835 [Saccharothrix sp. ALI-22-I]|nr:hypothetical protein ALI22I_02835 [Saccharothrix sp. ALI-22-I]
MIVRRGGGRRLHPVRTAGRGVLLGVRYEQRHAGARAGRGGGAGRWKANPARSTSPRSKSDATHSTVCPASATARRIGGSGLRRVGPPTQVTGAFRSSDGTW